jgi:Protein of unknown function (DUF2786)
MAETTREAVLRRIRKMMAMADDKRGDPNEIATMAEQAAKLMRKFNIEESELILDDLRKGVGIIADDIAPAQFDKRIPHWYNMLSYAVGKALDCQTRIVWSRTNSGEYKLAIRLYGYETDIRVAQWLFSYVVGQVDKLAEGVWKDRMVLLRMMGKTIHASTRRDLKNRYRHGVVSGLLRRIYEVYGKDSQGDTVEPAKASDVTGTALMLLAEAKTSAVKEAFKEFEFEYKTISAPKKQDEFWNGYAHSTAIKVQRVLEEEKEAKLLETENE